MSLSGSLRHAAIRYVERVEGYEDRFMVNLVAIQKKMKANTMPNRSWWRMVKDKDKVVGYIVGQGNWISSILSADMVPKGQQV